MDGEIIVGDFVI